MNPHTTPQSTRQSLLDQIASITTMQPGTLAEEWRESATSAGETPRRSGPYYKHQVWREGRNVSRRVPATEAAQLREDIDNAKRYEKLTDELARLNIEHTLELRRAQADSGESAECKKNSRRKRGQSVLPKPKPSLRKPKRG